TPLVLHLTRRTWLDPRPHLVGLAIASNLGSAATLTGNPQNMIIGGLSGVSYLRFAAKLAPPALLGLLIGYALPAWGYRDPLRSGRERPRGDGSDGRGPGPLRRAHAAVLTKSLAVTLGAVGLFFAGAPMAVVALAAAALLLLDRLNPERVYRQVDWGLLVMF